MRGSTEHALRQGGWILRDDLRRGLSDLDDSEFAKVMLDMERDGLAEFKLVEGTTWMRVTHLGLSTSDKWRDAVARPH